MIRNILLLFFAVTIVNPVFSQSGGSEVHKLKISNLYGGLGAGFGYKGGIIGMSSTFILTNDWGGSISYKNNFLKAEKNLPIIEEAPSKLCHL